MSYYIFESPHVCYSLKCAVSEVYGISLNGTGNLILTHVLTGYNFGYSF